MLSIKRKSFNKKIATLLVIVVLCSSFSPIFARKAEAFIFTDWINFAVNAVTSIGTHAIWIKEYALDAVAYQVLNLVIERMAASTVNWINTGFRGSPAFVTDPEGYFKDIGDKIAGQYIFSNPNLNFLCGPISAKIRLALTQNYIQERQWQCTLTDAIGNVEDFMGDFEKGGWDKFFEMTQKPQNNPIGAYLQAENEMNLQIATRQGTKQKELDWGNGFMSFEVCGPEGRDPKDGVCIGKAEISTPGAVISNQLNNVLGLGPNKLAVADEINEIISALLNQLTSKIIGGIGSGLRSLSDKSSTGGSSFADQLSNESKNSQIDKYFQDSNANVNNALNLPPYDANTCRNNPNLPECLPPPNSQSCDPTDPSCTLAP